MDDEELTRLAIEELVREMGEVPPDTTIRERKINPIAKPNKRFLGRTLNSIVSHNKREKERTHKNCQRKLQELYDDRRRYDNQRHLSLSSSSDEERRKAEKDERGKRYDKATSRKRKSDKRKRGKTKKSKSKRRASSSDSTRRSSTSRSSRRSRIHKKHKKHKKLEYTDGRINKNEEEVVDAENVYYEPCANLDMNLNPALWMNCYGEQQMQQLLEYSKLLTERETAENKDVLEELQISDGDAPDTQQQIDLASISTGVSSLRLDEDSTSDDGSGVLKISVSSGSSSSSSAPAGYKIMRKKRLKKRQKPEKSNIADLGASSNCLVLELDSDSSKVSKASEHQATEKKQDESGDCICIGSSGNSTASDANTKNNSSDSSASSSDSDDGGSALGVANKISYAATDTVMLVTTSSDSEVEVVDIEAELATQNQAKINAEAAGRCNMDIESSSVEQAADADNEALNLTNSHLNSNDPVGLDLETALNSAYPAVEGQVEQQQQNESEEECKDLQKEQQQTIISELVSNCEPRDSLNLAVKSPISHINTNYMVCVDPSNTAISAQPPVELKIKHEAEPSQKIESNFVSENEPTAVSNLTAQSPISYINSNDMVGIAKIFPHTPPLQLQIYQQSEQQHKIESEYVSEKDPNDSTFPEPQSSVKQLKPVVIVGIDTSTISISQQHTIGSESVSPRECGDLLAKQKQQQRDLRDSANLASQTSISHLNNAEMVGLDLSTTSVSPQSPIGLQGVKQTAQIESKYESGVEEQVSSSYPITTISTAAATPTTIVDTATTWLDLSTKLISQGPQLKCQEASEQPENESGKTLVIAVQTSSSHLGPSDMVSMDLSTKSNSPQPPIDLQVHETMTNEAENSTQDIELLKATNTSVELDTNLMVVRNSNSPSKQSNNTFNERDIVTQDSTTCMPSDETKANNRIIMIEPVVKELADISSISQISAQSLSSKTTTASESESDFEQITVSDDEQMRVDQQHVISNCGGSGPPPPIS